MRHPYADFLGKVDKPSRYLGGEYQEARKDPAAVRARVCLAFPDVYEIGMSHLGTKILYGILNRHPDIACERAFAPWIDCEAELRARGLPVLTLESAAPLRDFDVVGFSLQYELTYTNVLNLLDLSGIALRAAARGDGDPLILCGGPTATHPEPLAPFVDAFFIGEGEELLPPLVLEFAELRRAGVARRERLARLAARYPLYVPELYEAAIDEETGFVVVGAPMDARVPARPRRAWVADINRFPFPDDSPLPYAEAIFDRMAVEVARGCTEGCRFCQAGMIYRPVRERDPVAVVDALLGGVKKGGYDETSLTSLSTADYSCVTPLVKTAMAKLRDEKVSLSVSSLRAYGLNEDLLGEMASMRAGGLTFAPEAGTQRMRDVITKNVTEDDIIESAHRVFGRGFQRMKLYFMIGLPTEEDADVTGIVDTAARVQAIGRRHQRASVVTASVSTHVPKPHTPFQWAAMDSEAETARKQGLLAGEARRQRVELKTHENHQSHIEGIFSRGDRRVADVLEAAFRLGCRFDGWDDVLRVDLWDQAIEASGVDVERYLGTIPVTARLPWDHIDIGLEPDFLRTEYRKALKDRLSPPCGKPYKQLLHHTNVADAEAGRKQKLVCYDCGIACDLDAMKTERLYYLRRMNAWIKPPATTAAAARPEAGAVVAKGKRPQPTARIEQGAAQRYRLRYTKTGRVAYLGHLDLIRHLPRIFRRAGLELFYSGGFHPKPDLSFGPALGLGIPSLGELIDVRLIDRLSPDELLRRLRPVSLGGVDFLAAAALGDSDRALGRVITQTEFAARLPAAARESADESIDRALAAFAGGAPLRVRRASDGGAARRGDDSASGGLDRIVDVRRSLLSVAALEDAALRRALDWPDGALLRFRVAVSHEGSARPSEVVTALLGAELGATVELARLALWNSDGASQEALVDPLDVEALRQRAPVPAAATAAAAAPAAS
ncbi:MAG TPA: TIGR03960 family B12-binding radical SAM protein [Polyangia bacterium]|nr:TIGR03960 family B12-binding radical SAM protein [Polyangia bacterium]